MIVRAGHVYRCPTIAACYLIVIESYGQNNAVMVRLVNTSNWIVLGAEAGTLLSDGSIDCPALNVAHLGSMHDYELGSPVEQRGTR